MGIPNPMQSDSPPKSSDSAWVKSKGCGAGAAGKKTLEDRARSAGEQVPKVDAPSSEMLKANRPGPEKGGRMFGSNREGTERICERRDPVGHL